MPQERLNDDDWLGLFWLNRGKEMRFRSIEWIQSHYTGIQGWIDENIDNDVWCVKYQLIPKVPPSDGLIWLHTMFIEFLESGAKKDEVVRLAKEHGLPEFLLQFEDRG